ncbi:CGNR zinc finger domain-containing protein [Acidiphilium sp. AL]|uniref:CGNR zinc finger domain-containing protein n=1 Tax=Acidiphilium iwatense TaxID=768198 RepID=A0ABS9DZT8_9PROT|nr:MULTISPECIES: CGNR zinc finger domain-containing protein [Acidiphilium]MCF3946859.1 CGNR zinc finger domain-containing protein [Acidiphilium iwatense]MCU4161044.1 CGNR zinc finger domain-containing protein [Acidiphilium sp. AL]
MSPPKLIGNTPTLTLTIANSAIARKPAGSRERRLDDPFRDIEAFIRFASVWLAAEKVTVSQGDLARMVCWRDALFEILTAFINGTASSAALAVVNQEAERALSIRRISAELTIETAVCDSFVELLVGMCLDELEACDPTRLKRCLRRECGLFFYDKTRNRSARWHAEDPCGWRSRGERRNQDRPV